MSDMIIKKKKHMLNVIWVS